jgi:hypothetical protein
MKSVPVAVATGLGLSDLERCACVDPVANAPGIDLFTTADAVATDLGPLGVLNKAPLRSSHPRRGAVRASRSGGQDIRDPTTPYFTNCHVRVFSTGL